MLHNAPVVHKQEAVFLKVIGTQILRLLLHAIHSHLSPLYISNLGLEISTATAESGWRLGFVYINSLFTFLSNTVISYYTLFIYKYIEKTVRNASKGGKPDRKPYHPYGFRNPYKTINQ
jgi:hypothetical protein